MLCYADSGLGHAHVCVHIYVHVYVCLCLRDATLRYAMLSTYIT